MSLKIVEVIPQKGCRLLIKFNEGTVGRASLTKILVGPDLAVLKDERRFATAQCNSNGGVTWENGVSLSADVLRELVKIPKLAELRRLPKSIRPASAVKQHRNALWVRRAIRTSCEAIYALFVAEGIPRVYLDEHNVRPQLASGDIGGLPSCLLDVLKTNLVLKDAVERHVALIKMSPESDGAADFALKAVRNSAVQAARMHLRAFENYSEQLKGLQVLARTAGEAATEQLVAAVTLAAQHEAQVARDMAALEAARQGLAEAREAIEAEVLSRNARKGADAAHAENREIAERIKAWYFDNQGSYRSLDGAAEAVIKIEPVSFRTARKHIGQAAKDLRSAGRA